MYEKCQDPDKNAQITPKIQLQNQNNIKTILSTKC